MGSGTSAGELLSCVDVPEQCGRIPGGDGPSGGAPNPKAGLLLATAGKSRFDRQHLVNLTVPNGHRTTRPGDVSEGPDGGSG